MAASKDALDRALKRETLKFRRLKLRLAWWEERQPGGHQVREIEEQIDACKGRITAIESGAPPTKTVKDRMRILLDDGQWHTKQELHGCLWDELSPMTAIFAQLTALRKELNDVGDDLLTERSSLGIRYRIGKGHLLASGPA